MVPIIPGHLKTGLSGAKKLLSSRKTGLSGAKRLLSLALAYKN